MTTLCLCPDFDDGLRAKPALGMLAYDVEWHTRDALRELIFDDDDIAGVQALRKFVVAKARRSASAKQKVATRLAPENLPVQSFQDLLKDMGTLSRQNIRIESSESLFNQLTESTPLQRRVLELLSTHAQPDTVFSFQGGMTLMHRKNTGFRCGSLFERRFKFGLARVSQPPKGERRASARWYAIPARPGILARASPATHRRKGDIDSVRP